VFVFLIIAVQLGGAPFPWRLLFLQTTFWDVLYLAVLIAVAWIWSPGPESFQYAYYEQSAGTEDAGGGGMVVGVGDVELAAPHGVAGGSTADMEGALVRPHATRTARRRTQATTRSWRPGCGTSSGIEGRCQQCIAVLFSLLGRCRGSGGSFVCFFGRSRVRAYTCMQGHLRLALSPSTRRTRTLSTTAKADRGTISRPPRHDLTRDRGTQPLLERSPMFAACARALTIG
jgi:hypothetical protein